MSCWLSPTRVPARRAIAFVSLVLATLPGCERSKVEAQGHQAATQGVSRSTMDPETAARVLAKVGERSITLGDYVTALERLDPLERLRYQTPERRKLLLDELINLELLAREAERLGLDKQPQTRAALDQLLRQELLRRLRTELPAASDISKAKVREYYASHQESFVEPERRRVAVIATRVFGRAQRVLEEALGADAVSWQRLVKRYSALVPKSEPSANTPTKPSKNTALPASTIAGDLGVVVEPTAARENPRVPDAVRKAAFEISREGEVHPEVVSSGRLHFIVRATQVIPARQLTLDEADTLVRTRLTEQQLRRAEARLDDELAKSIEVTVDESKLTELRLPAEVLNVLKNNAKTSTSVQNNE